MYVKILSMLVFAGFLAACEPTIANRGNILEPDKLAQVKAGTSTREEVVASLGTPTLISTFDDKIWYYAGRQTEQYSFLDPEILKQKAVEIKFNDDGVVTEVLDLDVAKETRNIDPVDRSTPTYGNDDTLIKQLLGTLSHPSPGDPQKREGQ